MDDWKEVERKAVERGIEWNNGDMTGMDGKNYHDCLEGVLVNDLGGEVEGEGELAELVKLYTNVELPGGKVFNFFKDVCSIEHYDVLDSSPFRSGIGCLLSSQEYSNDLETTGWVYKTEGDLFDTHLIAIGTYDEEKDMAGNITSPRRHSLILVISGCLNNIVISYMV